MINTPITADLLRGAVDLETTSRGVLPHRLPAWARAQCPDNQLLMAESQPSGVRLVFRSTATTIELDTIPTKRVYEGVPPRPDGRYDLRVDGELSGQATVNGGDTMMIDMTRGTSRVEQGPAGTLRFDLPSADPSSGPMSRRVEIWLPHDETTVLVGLRTDAPVEPVVDHDQAVWLHHGSSISHGSNADRPTSTWPAQASQRAGVELINMGLGGSALLDPFTARTMRDTPADLISIKIGINIVNGDLMRLRAFAPAVHGFLDTIRDGHLDAPLLVVSPTYCPIHENTPGPCRPDLRDGRLHFLATGDPAETTNGKLTLMIIRDTLAAIVEQRRSTDPHLHYLDGRRLYGEEDFDELPLPDGLHPDPASHRRIGHRFAALAFDGAWGQAGRQVAGP